MPECKECGKEMEFEQQYSEDDFEHYVYFCPKCDIDVDICVCQCCESETWMWSDD